MRPTLDDVYIKQRNQSITRIFKGTIETASPPLMFIWSGGSTMSLIVRIRPIRADRNQREGDTDSVLYLVFRDMYLILGTLCFVFVGVGTEQQNCQTHKKTKRVSFFALQN